MGRPQKGQRVTHSSTGESGIVSAVIRGVVYAVMRDGSIKSGYAGSFHKSGGWCPLVLLGILAIPVVSFWGGWELGALLA